MLHIIFHFLAGLFSNAADLDCVFTITYQPLSTNQKFMDELRHANAAGRKDVYCPGNSPCSPDTGSTKRITYTDFDENNSGNPSRKYQENGLTEALCKKKAQEHCRVERAGTLTSKTVVASYQGKPLFKKICKIGGITQDVDVSADSGTRAESAENPKPAKSGGSKQ